MATDDRELIATEAFLEEAARIVVDVSGPNGGRIEQWFVRVDGPGTYIVGKRPEVEDGDER